MISDDNMIQSPSIQESPNPLCLEGIHRLWLHMNQMLVRKLGGVNLNDLPPSAWRHSNQASALILAV
jgi:hypothetical protein